MAWRTARHARFVCSSDFDPVRHRAGRTATLVSVATNLLLTLLQIIVGVFAHSQALIADAIHTLSDLLADGVVLAANAQSRKAPDDDHQYGHLRFRSEERR